MLAVAAAAVALLATSAQAQTLNTLKDDRAAGRFTTFLPFNAEQRDGLLTQVETVLGKAWVNAESKLINYGAAGDIFPIITDLRKNIATVSDADLQLKISDAFIRGRDLHTRFFMAGPHRCFSATTGVFFELVEGADTDIANNPRVVVSRKDPRAGVTALLGADFAAITVGDELVSVNGDSFVQWFKKNQFTSGAGANDFGGHRRALDYLNVVPGSINRLPAQDTITFTFKSRATGATYSSVINYVTSRNNGCWTATTNLYKKLTNSTVPGASAADQASFAGDKETSTQLPVAANPLKRPMAIIESPFLEHKKEALGDLAIGPVDLKPSGVPGLSFGIWDPKGKNLGVLRLDNFTPPDDAAAIEIIRSLLIRQLKDTNAIMIDLRDNGGGSITYANSIPQLFKPDFNPFGARYLYNDVMKRTFVDPSGPGDEWHDVYGRTKPGSKYTEIGLFDFFENVNTVGQAYLKPVGILNNGRCYSACDMLSANFQDSATGTIFGEDGATGAGGANILQLPELISINPTDFKPVPFTTELTVGATLFGNRITTGIRQSVRNGLNEGKLIEDLGIKADTVIRARIEDILPGATTSSQFDRIADALAEEGKKTGKAGLTFVLEPATLEVTAGSAKLSPEMTGLESITVQTNSGKRLGRRVDLFSNLGVKRVLPIPVTPEGKGLGNTALTIIGKKGDKQFLKTKRYIRSIPNAAVRLDASKGFNWDQNLSPAIGIYNLGTPLFNPTKGWTKAAGKWQVSDGLSYADNTDTSIAFFFTAPVGTKLYANIAATYDTEVDFDYFQVYIVGSEGFDGEATPLFTSTKADGTTVDGVSGKGAINAQFPITTTSEKFTMLVRFTADGGVTKVGAAISTFSLSTTPSP